MANPPHYGSSGPHRQRPVGHGNPPPIHEHEYLAYQQSHPQFGFEYDGNPGHGHPVSDQQPLHYTPSLVPLDQQRRPHLSVNVEPVAPPSISFDYAQGPSGASNQRVPPGFYAGVDGNQNPSGLNHEGAPPSTAGSGGSFSGFHPNAVENGLFTHLHLPQTEWQPGTAAPLQTGPPPKSGGRNGTTPGKVPRHQFTACGACRHRRVKCDLRARQDDAEREAVAQDSHGASARRRSVSCTNCQERGTNCVDEYAPLKAAKQLRRGKRISEIELLYGKSATDAALASQRDDGERALSPLGAKIERLPDLTREFFESPFFRRFHVERPVLDSLEFVARYLSKPIPCAAAMGPDGSVLCHAVYAWAVSYGVDERGGIDTRDGGKEQRQPSTLHRASEGELARDKERQKRLEKMNRVVRTVLREVDDYGLLRKPTWDGVRALLLILPLTEGISTPAERQAMYQASLSQVHMLCSQQGVGYDGRPIALPSSQTEDEQHQRLVQMRIFWYAYVHEGVTTALRGATLMLNGEEDFSTLEEALRKQPMVHSPGHYHQTLNMAVAPIRLSMACRLINETLTGARARRTSPLDPEAINAVWEALDRSWDEFTMLRNEPPAPPFREADEIIFYADAWKIFSYQAYHTVLQNIEDRLEKLNDTAPSTADSNGSRSVSPVRTDVQKTILQLRLLRDMAKTRCDGRARQILEMIREYAGTPFFEWDTSLTRDSVYYVAVHLLRNGGTNEDITLCLRVMNELRWAYSRSTERSQELRKLFFESNGAAKSSPFSSATDPAMSGAGASASSWPPSGTASRFSPTQDQPRSNSDPQVQAVPPPYLASHPHAQHAHAHGQAPQGQQSNSHSHNHSGHSHSQSPHGVVYALDQQAPQGQYILQGDGSSVFVPYNPHPAPM